MKKILSIVTAMVMIFCLMPPVRPFAAETVSAVRYTVNADNSVSKSTADLIAEKIDSTLNNWDNNIYYVEGNVEISDRIEVKGNAQLILTDGCSLTAKKGIHLKEGNSLTIYGQTNSSGTLTAEFYTKENGSPNRFDAAIGGNDGENAGDIEMHGGKITVPQTDIFFANLSHAAPIGGGQNGNGGNVTVLSGTVDIPSQRTRSAGIGGGYQGNGGTVKIYGGDITANNGIGGGKDGTNGDLYIYGGKVEATSQRDVSGGSVTVCGGEFSITDTINTRTASLVADKVTVNGGKITAKGTGCNGIKARDVTLNGGTLTAVGYEYGIEGSAININGGELNVQGGAEKGALSTEPKLAPDSNFSIFSGDDSFQRYHDNISAYNKKYFYVEKGSDYTVTFDYGGTSKIYTIPATGKITRPPNLEGADGKAFSGWYNGDELADFSAVYNENVTFTVKWGKFTPVDYVKGVVDGINEHEIFSDEKAYIAIPPLTDSDSDVVLDNNSTYSGSYNEKSYNGWCYVKGDVVIEGDLYTQVPIHLILTDGSSLTVNGRIIAGNAFDVFGQKGGTGKLIVNADSDEPALNYISLAGGNVEITNLKGPAASGDLCIIGGSFTAESENSPAITQYLDYSLLFYQGRLIAKSGTGKAIDYPEGKIRFNNKNVYYDIYTSPSADGSGKTELADISQLYTVLESSAYAEFKSFLCDHSANTNPTCEGAECSECGEYIAPTGHTEGDPVTENRTFTTCTEGGSYDEVIYCEICGKEISRENKVIEPSEHTPSAPVIENEASNGTYDEVVYCSVCNAELSREHKVKAEHVHVEGMADVITMPTFTSAGSRVFRCTVCGEIIRSETIPPITTNFTTDTESENNASQVIYTEFPELKFNVEIKDGKAVISWDKVETADKYVVYAVKDGKTSEIAKTKETSFETNHQNGTHYLVRYMKNGVLSPKSKSMNEGITSDKPMVTASAGKDFIRLEWQDMSAEKYNIYKYADGKAVKIGEVKGTAVKIKNLTADTEYKFIVTAVIDGKETVMLKSEIVTIKTKKA